MFGEPQLFVFCQACGQVIQPNTWHAPSLTGCLIRTHKKEKKSA